VNSANTARPLSVRTDKRETPQSQMVEG